MSSSTSRNRSRHHFYFTAALSFAAATTFLLGTAPVAFAADATPAPIETLPAPANGANAANANNNAGATCAVEHHVGLTASEAAAIEEVVCSHVRTNQVPGRHRVRVTKIGSKVILNLVSQINGSMSEKQLALSSLDEVNIAAPRLFEAAAEQKPVGETVDVTNVVGDEARTPKKKNSMVHGWLGVIGAGAYGQGAGGGVSMGLSAGSDRWSFVGDLRLAGESFNKPAALAATIFTLGSTKINTDADLAFVSLSAGARHHFSSSDISPFVGMGLGLDYIAGKKPAPLPNIPSYPSYGSSYSSSSSKDAGGKTGIAAYAEVGLDVLRTHTVGGAIVLRADAPAFMLEQSEPVQGDPTKRLRTSAYVPVMSAGITLRF